MFGAYHWRYQSRSIGDLHILQIGRPADDRDAVGGCLVSRRIELLIGQGLGVVLGSHPPFFLDHFQLLEKLLLRQSQKAHALGLQLEGDGQAIRRQSLEIGRVVPAGEGVLVTAVRGNDPRELAGGQLLRALEHHVFEQMGNPGQATVLVTGAYLVPDLGGDDGRAMVLLDQYLEAVIEEPLLNLGGLGGGDQGDRQGRGEK